MFRSLLTLGLPLITGGGLGGMKAAIQRKIRSAVGWAVAGLLLAAAAVFALIAVYGLLLRGGLDTVQAAGLMAAALAVVAVGVVATVSLVNRRQRTPSQSTAAPAGHYGDSPIGALDQQVGRAVQQVGPISLLAMAFAIGLLAGRR